MRTDFIAFLVPVIRTRAEDFGRAQIAPRAPKGGNHFVGAIDEVAIWMRARDADEI